MALRAAGGEGRRDAQSWSSGWPRGISFSDRHGRMGWRGHSTGLDCRMTRLDDYYDQLSAFREHELPEFDPVDPNQRVAFAALIDNVELLGSSAEEYLCERFDVSARIVREWQRAESAPMPAYCKLVVNDLLQRAWMQCGSARESAVVHN
jgi:hypothetical protein